MNSDLKQKYQRLPAWEKAFFLRDVVRLLTHGLDLSASRYARLKTWADEMEEIAEYYQHSPLSGELVATSGTRHLDKLAWLLPEMPDGDA